MNLKKLAHRFYEKICNYNIFMREENEYNDDNDEQNDPAIILKQQKYATWLYVLLLIGSLYILSLATLMTSNSRIIHTDKISVDSFAELYHKYSDTLSCPCSTISIPLKNFVSSTINYHPVCSSHFISQQWIEELYFEDASKYGTGDFRSTASSQFQLLSTFCLISQDVISQRLEDLYHDEFIYNDLLLETQVQQKVNATVEFFKNNASSQITLFLNYLRTTIQANVLISALNTNLLFMLDKYIVGDTKFHSNEISYTEKKFDGSTTEVILGCSNSNPTSLVGFLSIFNDSQYKIRQKWTKPSSNESLVNGFYTACTPLEAILQSTLDCLYDMKCLELLSIKFPNINRTFLKPLDLNSKKENISVIDHLSNLFIDEWLITEINYSKYFNECFPLICTYKISQSFHFSYVIILFMGLYGGLTIILRLIVLFLINIYWKMKYHRRNSNIFHIFQMIYLYKFVQYIKQLNLFKNLTKRTENDIKKQKIITIVYLILLTNSCLILVLFTSINTEFVTIEELNPLLDTYDKLYIKHSNTLQCSCSSMVIPYQSFIRLSPIFHQVCSSDFIKDEWITLLKYIKTGHRIPDWRNRAFAKFSLLSYFCKLAQKIVEESSNHFLSKLFIVSNILSKIDFNLQINATLDAFFQSTNDSFTLLTDTERLLMRTDLPYSGPFSGYGKRFEEENPSREYSRLELHFMLTGPRDANNKSLTCICGFDIHCRIPLHIYDVDCGWTDEPKYIQHYTVPGSYAGYTNCLSIIMNYSKQTYLYNVEYSSWFHVHPLTLLFTVLNALRRDDKSKRVCMRSIQVMQMRLNAIIH
ncbi:hypothetical protein I4U23_005333 [Adineta vaga]|nr:hypothetical protein I4U23_005333 [Adineta vaga]